MTLQQCEVHPVFSWESCPYITGPWQWQAAQAPWRGGVDSDLCLHNRLLGGCGNSLNISCPSLLSGWDDSHGSHHLWISFRQRSESPVLVHPETVVS